ncbi:MAG TPA: polysaccharide deacetylase family protein [Leptolinea sp.]
MIRHPILSYHQITMGTPPEDFGEYAMSARQFEWQMNYLYEHGYVCLSLPELFQYLIGGESPRKKAFALTFDDGYEDFYTTAHPILLKYGFTAAVFLVSDLISMPDELRLARKNRYLSWEQIKELQQKGITFGSHTATHCFLPSLKPDEVFKELTASKACLEAGLGKDVKWFAYPYSASTREIENQVEAAGYQAAFSGSRGRNSAYDIRRQFCLKDESQMAFEFRLSRLYSEFTRIRDETELGQFFRKAKYKLSHREN